LFGEGDAQYRGGRDEMVVLFKGKTTCELSVQLISDHFPNVRKMVYIININNLQNQTFLNSIIDNIAKRTK
jgi:hypothetical protein